MIYAPYKRYKFIHRKTMEEKEEIVPETGEGQNEIQETAAADCVPAQSQKAARIPLNEKVLTKKQRILRIILSWVLMQLGVFIMSVSVYFFQIPNDFTLGGIGGMAILISKYVTPLVPWLTQAVLMAIINVLLILIGLLILGKQCTIKTIICSLAYTLEVYIFELIFPAFGNHEVTISTLGGGTPQPFLELVYAILLFGVGGALVFNCGASSGGTDIIALILKKFTNINVGVALMLVDLVVVLVSFFTFTPEQALFSLMGLFTKSFILDGVIESMGKTKYITIITTMPDEIDNYIIDVIQHGCTMYDAEGGYTGEKKKILITVCKRNEAFKLKNKIKEIDPGAFVIITDANEILGKGFGGTV